RYYHTALDARAVESLLYSWSDVWPVVAPSLPAVAAMTAAVAVVEYWLLTLSAGAFGRPRRLPLGLALATVSLAAAAPALGVTRRYLSPPEAVARAQVPELPSTRTVLPNVLLLLTESVRASDYCSGHEGDCSTSPEVDALLPDRLPLNGMRAVASYTAVSVAALFTGRPPLGPLATVSAAPGLFDFTKAIRVTGRAPAVAYWSAQLGSVFWRRDVRLRADSFVTVEELVGHGVGDEDEVLAQGVDRRLTAYVEAHVRDLPEPFTLTVHFQGTHAPYFTDDAHAPFQPMSHTVTWSGLEALHDAYRDAIFEQDRSVARCIRAFLARVGPEPYVIVFTSDHGEAFGEHGAIHHGQNLYDEQLHVPAWIAHGNGALSVRQIEALKSYRDAVVTHFDVLPTLLDIAGVLDGYALSPLRRALIGRSLLAPRTPLAEPVPVTNCTSLFPCPLDTWGVLDDAHLLAGQPWDSDFRCLTLQGAADAPPEDCASLLTASRRWFPKKPNGRPNR
ncbi:MAG TPA: sulfatase-like hydrolase/transferase, partial [Polyangiaceae bacterium]|nr:sulfatase-like hydrolase/transferase [Polyangiaceae bacterium]